MYLEVNPEHPGDHRLGQVGVPTTAVTIDGLLSQRSEASVSLIKIDVQGAEMQVLEGACSPSVVREVYDG